jgi:hypothetical protein
MNPGDRCQTDDELLAFARQYGHTAYHVVGTCKMGHDPRAVVDDELRVHGAASLRVVDASIMPRMTSGNTCPVAVERLIVDDAPDRGPKSRPVMDEGPTVGIDAEALRRLLTRQPVVLPTSAGDRVALILGEIDWHWVAQLATQAVREEIARGRC